MELIIRDFIQLELRKTIIDYINSYDIYIKAKHSRYKSYRKLQTPILLEQAWLLVALNFITKLLSLKEPLTGAIYNSILIIVNILTKYAYLELYKEVSIIEDLVYIFNKIVIARHGILDRIILD